MKKLPKKDKKTVRFTVRFTPAEANRIQKAAGKKDIACFLRRAGMMLAA